MIFVWNTSPPRPQVSLCAAKLRSGLFCRDDIRVMGLAAVHHLDFEVRIAALNAPGRLLCHLLRDSLSVVERDDLQLLDMHAFQRLVEDMLPVLAGDHQVAVDDADVVPLAHAHAIRSEEHTSEL